MSFGGVSRRELLAGLAGVGVVAGAVEAGAGAWRLPAGSSPGRRRARAAEEDAVPATNAGETEYVSITLDLPQRNGHVNNPAIVWVRLTCLEDLDVPTDDLRVELTYDSGVLDGLSVFGPASLTELLDPDSPARRGVPLAVSHDEYCFDTSDGGDPMRLRLRISLADEYRGELAFGLPLEFVAYQCRGESGLDNPFAGRPVPPCDGSTPRPDPDPAISFLSFCVRADGPNSVPDPDAIEILAETTKDDGEVTDVELWMEDAGDPDFRDDPFDKSAALARQRASVPATPAPRATSASSSRPAAAASSSKKRPPRRVTRPRRNRPTATEVTRRSRYVTHT